MTAPGRSQRAAARRAALRLQLLRRTPLTYLSCTPVLFQQLVTLAVSPAFLLKPICRVRSFIWRKGHVVSGPATSDLRRYSRTAAVNRINVSCLSCLFEKLQYGSARSAPPNLTNCARTVARRRAGVISPYKMAPSSLNAHIVPLREPRGALHARACYAQTKIEYRTGGRSHSGNQKHIFRPMPWYMTVYTRNRYSGA